MSMAVLLFIAPPPVTLGATLAVTSLVKVANGSSLSEPARHSLTASPVAANALGECIEPPLLCVTLVYGATAAGVAKALRSACDEAEESAALYAIDRWSPRYGLSSPYRFRNSANNSGSAGDWMDRRSTSHRLLNSSITSATHPFAGSHTMGSPLFDSAFTNTSGLGRAATPLSFADRGETNVFADAATSPGAGQSANTFDRYSSLASFSSTSSTTSSAVSGTASAALSRSSARFHEIEEATRSLETLPSADPLCLRSRSVSELLQPQPSAVSPVSPLRFTATSRTAASGVATASVGASTPSAAVQHTGNQLASTQAATSEQSAAAPPSRTLTREPSTPTDNLLNVPVFRVVSDDDESTTSARDVDGPFSTHTGAEDAADAARGDIRSLSSNLDSDLDGPRRDLFSPLYDTQVFPEGVAVPVTLQYIRIGDDVYSVTEVVDRTFVQYREERLLPNGRGGGAHHSGDAAVPTTQRGEPTAEDEAEDELGGSGSWANNSFHALAAAMSAAASAAAAAVRGASNRRRRRTAASTQGFGHVMYSLSSAPTMPGTRRQLVHMCWRCLSAEASVILLPCGHYAVCAVCAEELRDCCVCHTTIRSTVMLK